MCVIFLAYRSHPDYALILAANRDEFYARPTSALAWWESSQIAGGKDLEAGGAWIACDRKGRWGALTNFRDPAEFSRKAKSRGHLIKDFLENQFDASEYLDRIKPDAQDYNGFNLLLGDHSGLHYYTNRKEAPRQYALLEPGIYGLSNAYLDTDWPKVVSGKVELERIINQDPLNHELYFEMLADETRARPDQLPDTGIGMEKELMLSSRFIRSPVYGTRAMTSLLIHNSGQIRMQEKLFGPDGHPDANGEAPTLEYQIELDEK